MFNDPQFWVSVAFIIFILAIFKPVRTMLTSNLDKKINEIKKNIEKAEKIKIDAQKTFSEIKNRHNNVKQEIRIIENEAKEKISVIEQRYKQELNEKLNKHNELAKIKVQQMVRDANTEVQRHIVQSVIKATIEILEKKLDKLERQKLIDQSMVELNSILKH